MKPLISSWFQAIGGSAFVVFGPFQPGTRIKSCTIVSDAAASDSRCAITLFRERPSLDATGFASGERTRTPSSNDPTGNTFITCSANVNILPLSMEFDEDFHYIGFEFTSAIAAATQGSVALDAQFPRYRPPRNGDE